MSKRIYNERLISLNGNLIDGMSREYIINKLRDRTLNLEERDFEMDYKDVAAVTVFDHYMCKKMIEGEFAYPDGRLEAYCNEISNQLIKQPLLFYSLPIRNVNVSILRKYIPKIDEICFLCNKSKIQALTIAKKFNNGISVSKDELNLLVKYFNYSCKYDTEPFEIEIQDKLVKYLMENANSLGVSSSSFIFKYLGYKKCREEGLEDIEIFIGDLKSINSKCLGASFSSIVFVSKKYLVGTNFKDNTLSQNNAQLKNGRFEGLVLLKTLFHELRHAVQDKNVFDKSINDISFSKSIVSLLRMVDSSEYKRNYRFYDIEADANYYGWRWVEDAIANYMNVSVKDRLKGYSDIYAAQQVIKRGMPSKTDENTKQLPIWSYTVKKLDEYFLNNPRTLSKEYSQFSCFYNLDGKPKSLVEILRIDSIKVSNFPEMFTNMVFARASGSMSIGGLSLDEKRNLINNLNTIIYNVYRKFSVYKRKNTGGKHIIEDLSLEEQELFKYNVKNYYKRINVIARMASKIIQLEPALLGYKGGSVSINYYLKLINQNELIQSIVCGNQLDYIPESAADLANLSNLGRGR